MSAEAQALQNTSTVEQQEQQEDTQIQFQTLTIKEYFLQYPGYAQNLYTFTGITRIPSRLLSQQSTKNETHIVTSSFKNINSLK